MPNIQDQQTEEIPEKCLFISDVHLGGFSDEENSRTERSLIKLIDYADRNSYHIQILGDLFDYWMEYPNRTPGIGETLLNRFRQYNRKYGPTLYITGNHDNWTDGYFEEIGFEIEENYRILTAGNRRILLLHGDGIDSTELGLPRPLHHRLLRSPLFIRCYQKIFPPETGLKLMKWFSKINRLFEQVGTSPGNLDRWAQKTLSDHDIDLILCGHDHTPRILNFSFGTYLNLGTFYRDRTLVKYNKGEFELVVWNDEEETLTEIDTIRNTP